MSNSSAARGRPTGRVVRPEKNGKTKTIRARARWSEAAEEAFLAELAATCNVSAAAEAAGFSTTAIYNRRMRWPGFAQAWADALEQGYARLEAMMLQQATDSLRSQPIDGARPAPAVSFDQGLNLLKLHRASVRGGAAQKYAHRERPRDIEEVRASILGKMDALERVARKANAQWPEQGPARA